MIRPPLYCGQFPWRTLSLSVPISDTHKVPQPQAHNIKFYTLNRKSTRKPDPYSQMVPNIEVDSRLRNRPLKSLPLNGNDLENRRSYSFEVEPEVHVTSPEKVTQYHSATDVRTASKMNGGVVKSSSPQDKSLARVVLSQRIKQAEEQEKRHSREINASPVSTKGEVTTTQSTKSSSSPVLPTKRWSANSPKMQRKPLPSHVTEFSKAGSAPPCLPPDGKADGALPPSVMSKAHGMKQLNTVGKWKSPPSLVDKKERPPAPDPVSPSIESAPLITKEDSLSSSGDLYSPTDDFTFVPAGKDGSRPKRPISGAGSVNRSSSGSNQNYDHLDEFVGRNKKHDSWESFSTSASSSPAPPITFQGTSTSSSPAPPISSQGQTEDTLSPARGSQSSSRFSNTSSDDDSGEYDHLPSTPGGRADHLPSTPGGRADECVMLDIPTPPKRNISQPALSTPLSARESPCDQFGRFGSIDEESSDEELGATPTNSDDEECKGEAAETGGITHKGVVLRKKRQQQHLEDPFAALLSSPKASSRLRWSQELNPLYDYIKGFKAEGVKLYDSTPVSKLLQSTSSSMEGGTPGKPPSVILEAFEGEGDERLPSVSECEGDTQSVSSLDAQSMDAQSMDTQSMDSQSIWSQDAMYSPTSPSPLNGDRGGLAVPKVRSESQLAWSMKYTVIYSFSDFNCVCT